MAQLCLVLPGWARHGSQQHRHHLSAPALIRLQAPALLRAASALQHQQHRALLRPEAALDSASSDADIHLPDAHRLLQVSPAASKDTCLKAYDRLIGSPPEAGYSQVWSSDAFHSACRQHLDLSMLR